MDTTFCPVKRFSPFPQADTNILAADVVDAVVLAGDPRVKKTYKFTLDLKVMTLNWIDDRTHVQYDTNRLPSLTWRVSGLLQPSR